MKTTIYLNADLGEGCSNDAGILPLIDIANIACGAHAGDSNTMRETLVQVRELGLLAGAHLGYADRENFGRVSISYSAAGFAELLGRQLEELLDIAGAVGVNVGMIKPHGALYHDLGTDAELATQFIACCQRYAASFAQGEICYIGPDQSQLLQQARALQLPTLSEGFVDRRYNNTGQLLSRSHTDAMISNADDALQQGRLIATEQQATSNHGQRVNVIANTLCLHGDGSNALEIAKTVSAGLRQWRPR